MIKISHEKLFATFKSILLRYSFNQSDAETLAEIFSENSLVGVSSHGVNRFPLFIELIKSKHIIATAKPTKDNSFNALEQWNANFGAGPLNAKMMTERAIKLSSEFGIGCVALKNSNHWMRPGYYAWEAADKGYIFICWTNTIPNLPPWGSKTSTTGNNPIVFGVPRKDGNIVLDMALSQFAYGKLANYAREDKELPFIGGYDKKGNLTKNAKDIYEAWRPLPIGYWKGTGLSLLLDLIATILSGGNSTSKLSKSKVDTGMSQIYIAIDPNKFASKELLDKTVNEILEYYLSAEKIGTEEISYPGKRIIDTKKKNLKYEIPVDEVIWQKVLSLKDEL